MRVTLLLGAATLLSSACAPVSSRFVIDGPGAERLLRIANALKLPPVSPVTLSVEAEATCGSSAAAICQDASAEEATITLLRAAALQHPSMPAQESIAAELFRRGAAARYVELHSGAKALEPPPPDATKVLLALHLLDRPVSELQGLDADDLERLGRVVSEGIDPAAFDRPECDASLAKNVIARAVKALRPLAAGAATVEPILLVDGTVLGLTSGSHDVTISHQHGTLLIRARTGVTHKIAPLLEEAFLRLDTTLAAFDLKSTQGEGPRFFFLTGPQLSVSFGPNDSIDSGVYGAIVTAFIDAERSAFGSP